MTPVPYSDFVNTSFDAILDGSDTQLQSYAQENLGYAGSKGLDLVARMNGKYIVGEAKFITDFGGHQNAQFQDAVNLFVENGVLAVKVAVLDGVLYLRNNSKLYRSPVENYSECNIFSALVLRDFLYQL